MFSQGLFYVKADWVHRLPGLGFLVERPNSSYVKRNTRICIKQRTAPSFPLQLRPFTEVVQILLEHDSAVFLPVIERLQDLCGL